MAAHMQIDVPMAAAYLLGLPDNYSGHQYKPFYWKSFVTHILSSSDETEQHGSIHGRGQEKVVITKFKNAYHVNSVVPDYM